MNLELLIPAEIDKYWPVCRDLLKDAFRNRLQLHSVDDYYNPLLMGNLQLWIVTHNAIVIGAVITSIDAGSNAKVFSVMSLAGEDLPLWIGLVDRQFTELAILHECDGIEWIGRSGFTKLVDGFVEDGRVFVKILR